MEWEVGCLWTKLAIRQQSLKHETVSCKKFGDDGRQCGIPSILCRDNRAGRETPAADVRLSGTRRAARNAAHTP